MIKALLVEEQLSFLLVGLGQRSLLVLNKPLNLIFGFLDINVTKMFSILTSISTSVEKPPYIEIFSTHGYSFQFFMKHI